MMKNVIALVGLTALTGLAVSVAAVGCSSSTTTDTTTTDGGDAGKKPLPDGSSPGNPDTDGGDGGGAVGHTGLPCTGEADCQADGDDDICSKGKFGQSGGNDVYPTPVCLDPNQCTLGMAGTIDDVLCDNGTGVCLTTANGGQCFPPCIYNSTGFEQNGTCAGDNKCAAAYILTKQDGTHAVLGFCFGGCTADADCKGSAGQKCQVEEGVCVQASDYKTYTGKPGDACDSSAATATCNCDTVGGTGADKTKGVCSSTCVTGAAGDTYCAGLTAGYKCTAQLDASDGDGGVLFSGQPDGVLGACKKPCTTDADCSALTTGTTAMKCQDYAGGKACEFPRATN